MHFHFFPPITWTCTTLLYFVLLVCLLLIELKLLEFGIKAAIWEKPLFQGWALSAGHRQGNSFSTSVSEFLHNSLFCDHPGKTEWIFSIFFPLGSWDRFSFDPRGKKDLFLLSLWITREHFFMVLWGVKLLLSFNHTLAMTAELYHLWVWGFSYWHLHRHYRRTEAGRSGIEQYSPSQQSAHKNINNFNPRVVLLFRQPPDIDL